jgi:hypothetical protein
MLKFYTEKFVNKQIEKVTRWTRTSNDSNAICTSITTWCKFEWFPSKTRLAYGLYFFSEKMFFG